MIVLSGCLVNQRDLWASDKLAASAPTTRAATLTDVPYGNDPLQKLDLYLPAAPSIGIIIWVHSGGWCCGGKSNVDPLILSQLDRGYAVASVNYRLAPSVTAEQLLADGDQAVRFVKAKRSSWGAGAGKVLIAGGSAGGTIALLLAATPGYFAGPELGALGGIDPRVDAVISLVGPSDFRTYIDGSISRYGRNLAEGFLGCSNLGENFPTTTTTTTPSSSSSSSSSSKILAL
jgi:acetyl esterase/lipase